MSSYAVKAQKTILNILITLYDNGKIFKTFFASNFVQQLLI